jgi:hypothetical protein
MGWKDPLGLRAYIRLVFGRHEQNILAHRRLLCLIVVRGIHPTLAVRWITIERRYLCSLVKVC